MNTIATNGTEGAGEADARHVGADSPAQQGPTTRQGHGRAASTGRFAAMLDSMMQRDAARRKDEATEDDVVQLPLLPAHPVGPSFAEPMAGGGLPRATDLPGVVDQVTRFAFSTRHGDGRAEATVHFELVQIGAAELRVRCTAPGAVEIELTARDAERRAAEDALQGLGAALRDAGLVVTRAEPHSGGFAT